MRIHRNGSRYRFATVRHGRVQIGDPERSALVLHVHKIGADPVDARFRGGSAERWVVADGVDLRIGRRQFMRDLIGRIGRCVVDDDHPEMGRDIGENIEQFLDLRAERGFGVPDGDDDSER